MGLLKYVITRTQSDPVELLLDPDMVDDFKPYRIVTPLNATVSVVRRTNCNAGCVQQAGTIIFSHGVYLVLKCFVNSLCMFYIIIFIPIIRSPGLSKWSN